MSEPLLTLEEAAERLGCSVSTIRRRIRCGALPAFVDGRLVRVRDVDLQRYVAERVRRLAPVRESIAAGSPAKGRLWE